VLAGAPVKRIFPPLTQIVPRVVNSTQPSVVCAPVGTASREYSYFPRADDVPFAEMQITEPTRWGEAHGLPLEPHLSRPLIEAGRVLVAAAA
jgi:hypothetical protein